MGTERETVNSDGKRVGIRRQEDSRLRLSSTSWENEEPLIPS